jgi:superfamily I DNA/RNA helicase
MVSQRYLAAAKPRYDFAVVDEVQDITNVQLALILRLLRREGEFLLSGDSNQIVHPNFFSWAHLKTLFFTNSSLDPASLVHVLRTNYRNAAGVNDLGNRLLRIKQRRFARSTARATTWWKRPRATPGWWSFLRTNRNCSRN